MSTAAPAGGKNRVNKGASAGGKDRVSAAASENRHTSSDGDGEEGEGEGLEWWVAGGVSPSNFVQYVTVRKTRKGPISALSGGGPDMGASV